MTISAGFPRSKKIGATPQGKTGARQSKANQDRAPENSKAPSGNLDKDQRIGQAGETVPIVFAKRVNDKGGVWVAPPLLKTGSKDFVPSLLFSISQGKIASTPDPINLWSGLSNQKLRIDSSITLSHVYKTSSQLTANPVCPIAGDGLYCGVDSFSYLQPVVQGSSAGQKTRIRRPARRDFYFGIRTITRGTGDTDNSVFYAQYKYYDNSTGNDVTSAYEAALGLTPGTQYTFNLDLSTPPQPVQVDGIVDLISGLGYIPPTTAFSSIGDGSGSFTEEVEVKSIQFQYDLSNPADVPYALTGVQSEVVASIYANPDTSTITDFTNYADITFLKVIGNLFGEPESGSMPPDAKQAYIFYDEGVEVDLYSAGLSGGSYTVGASNQLVDLAMHLFKLLKRVDGANTADIAAPMNISNMQAIAAFCTNYDLLFNGVISARVNVVDYLVSLAPCFLLSFVSLGGQVLIYLVVVLVAHRLDPLVQVQKEQDGGVSLAEFTDRHALRGGVLGSADQDLGVTERVRVWRAIAPNTVIVLRNIAPAGDHHRLPFKRAVLHQQLVVGATIRAVEFGHRVKDHHLDPGFFGR